MVLRMSGGVREKPHTVPYALQEKVGRRYVAAGPSQILTRPTKSRHLYRS